jgi:hypothetical protein
MISAQTLRVGRGGNTAPQIAGSCLNGSSQRQILRADFTPHFVRLDLEIDLLTFGKAGKTRPFNGADVNEHIVSAVIGLDKAKTLLPIKPFHSTCRHVLLQSTSRVTITRVHSTGRCLWEIARRRIQKGTAANRMGLMYGLGQENTRTARQIRLKADQVPSKTAAIGPRRVVARRLPANALFQK